MEYINSILQNQQTGSWLLAASALLALLLLTVVVRLSLKLNRLERLYRQMMEGTTGTSLETMLLTHNHDVSAALAAVDRLQGETQRLGQVLQSCIQKVGLVRYNAFEDTGSDLSFSLAVLDGNDNGIVLSSLYGRSESRIYAKPVTQLQSRYPLSTEEQQAIKRAKSAEPL
ncbi:MAG: DUF4446 family protein [Sporomusaceae bacterium]|nr:DUF4446 family protein [Sporomusaceae bacterium]